ncbi:MAG: NADH-quinone oxidoreductase subunit M [Desulfobacterota bacterium]|nr:NADH-quinone oxidoreductase subunit M [Thermodesulfobacteriota bacterium]
MPSLLFNNPGYPLLSMLLCLPLAGAALAPFVRHQKSLRLFGLVVTVATLCSSIPLYTEFDRAFAGFQFAEHYSWLSVLGIDYVVGVDGISAVLVLLTTLLMPLCMLCSWREVQERLAEFIVVLLLMEAALIGVFISLNIVLFYVFWEGMLIPMYLLIAIWGGPRRDYASVKFFVYTFAGSIFLLFALIALYVATGTCNYPDLLSYRFNPRMQWLVFVCCAIACAVKTPLYPLHTWLPAAHVEAPTAGSVILAGVLLKMGGYGFLRFCIGLAPHAAQSAAPLMTAVALVAILIGGCLALGQDDLKRLIAYSSIAHMGFVVLGMFMVSVRGTQAGVLQMVNHGISTSALFICVGMLYERTHSRLLADNCALGSSMPRFVTLFTLAACSSFGFPGTNGFIGEFLVIIAAFEKNIVLGACAVCGVLVAAAYMLRAVQKIIWADRPGNHQHGAAIHKVLSDINIREVFVLAVLAGGIVLIGFRPSVVLDMTSASVTMLVQRLSG